MPQTAKFTDEPECHFSIICSESDFNGKAFNRISRNLRSEIFVAYQPESGDMPQEIAITLPGQTRFAHGRRTENRRGVRVLEKSTAPW